MRVARWNVILYQLGGYDAGAIFPKSDPLKTRTFKSLRWARFWCWLLNGLNGKPWILEWQLEEIVPAVEACLSHNEGPYR